MLEKGLSFKTFDVKTISTGVDKMGLRRGSNEKRI